MYWWTVACGPVGRVHVRGYPTQSFMAVQNVMAQPSRTGVPTSCDLMQSYNYYATEMDETYS